MKAHRLATALASGLPLAAGVCKCTPGDSCWPSQDAWSQFNASVDGKLFATTPVAAHCYSGPENDPAACQEVTRLWTNASFESAQPLGYAYPLNSSCPPPSNTSSNVSSPACTLGSLPVYAVNATTEQDISGTISYARENGIRLVIKSTGHDSLQRSTGHGGLAIWLYHYRDGFVFNNANPHLEDCPATGWTGSTLTIKGAYAWSDIYPAAREKGVIIVGGYNYGPCSTGGWTQGGGHGPVTRNYGLGADQVLSARVVLASGEIVNASPCENADIFFAIRGGGGGTYGVITQITVKTYPTVNVNRIDLVVGSSGNGTVSRFLDAVTAIYASLPGLSKSGFAGYGNWAANAPPGVLGGNLTNLYGHSFTLLGTSEDDASKLFEPFRKTLLPYNDSDTGLLVTISQTSYPDYGSYFAAKPGTDIAVGGVSALGSRLMGTAALSANNTLLRPTMDIMAGTAEHPVYHTVVHHGLETASLSTRNLSSAVQPGWYNSIILDIFELQMDGLQVDQNAQAFNILRSTLEPAYTQLSPDTGTYMNEADWGNPTWKGDFYGKNWDRLNQIKASYDPEGVFYCNECVGSQLWSLGENGSLCKSS